MKLLNKNSIKQSFILLCLCISLCITTSTTNSALAPEKKGVKKGEDKAPVLKAPKLSQTLQELDPTRSLRRSDFIQTVQYPLFNLTRGEMEQIFYFADLNHDDLLDHGEWDKFTGFFILPFEKCDKKGIYVLDAKEFKECYKNDPKSKLIQIKKKYQKTATEVMMAVVSSRKKDNINFSDYLFIRRAMFGWQQCQSSAKYIAKSHFKCAFKLAIPQKYHLKLNFDQIYDVAIKVENDPGLTKLDFIGYLKIIYASYIFAVFGMPHNNPYIEKTQFLKALREDRLPNFFEENEVNTFYNLLSSNPLHKAEQMNFESWTFFFSLNRLFNKYSNTRPLHLTKKELGKLLNDTLAPVAILNAIDKSEVKFSASQYKEASLYLQKKSSQESDFYYSFKQPEYYLHTSDVVSDNLPFPRGHMAYSNVTANSKGREVFFSIMVDVDKQHWDKYTYYKAFQLSNLFVALTTDIRYAVSVSSVLTYLPKYYDMVNPSINQNQRRTLSFYKILPKECFLDILTFLEIENYVNKFRNTKISNVKTVSESLLKMVMRDYGMVNVPDMIIGLANTGYDKLKRKVYDSENVMRILMTIQTVAAENQRVVRMKKLHTIKDKVVIGGRRLKASNLV